MKTYKVGRYAEADITLTLNICSRNHAMLTVASSGKILLQDYSSNGTTVNGKKINNQTTEIKFGDEVLFGDVEKLDWNKIEKPTSGLVTTSDVEGNSFAKPFTGFFRRHAIKIIIVLFVISTGLLAFKFLSTRTNSAPEIPIVPSTIYSLYQNAVALVEVEYFVRIESAANSLYVGLGDNGTITISKTQSDLKPLSSQGTAFYVDSTGLLITNHHVVQPWRYDNKLQDYFNKKLKPLIIAALQNKGYSNPNPIFKGELHAIYIYPNGKSFSPENRIHCSIHKIADVEEIDLASIQINSHILPARATVLANSVLEKDEKKIEVNTSAYVIGFPLGDALAVNEDNVLNCSSTTGSFTQNPATYYIQFSAAVASGASGSPVFNQYGKLVAVTYLGSKEQSFNRGILAKYLREVK